MLVIDYENSVRYNENENFEEIKVNDSVIHNFLIAMTKLGVRHGPRSLRRFRQYY